MLKIGPVYKNVAASVSEWGTWFISASLCTERPLRIHNKLTPYFRMIFTNSCGQAV